MIASVAVTRALRLLGVLSPTEAATAADMVTGVEVLNSMLFGWVIDGIDLNHATVVQTDELLIDAEYLETVIHALASRLALEFGASVGGGVLARIDGIAERGKGLMRARFETPNELVVPRELRQGQYQRRNGLGWL